MAEFLNSPLVVLILGALIVNSIGIGIWIGRNQNTLELVKVNGKLITMGKEFELGYAEVIRRLEIVEANTRV